MPTKTAPETTLTVNVRLVLDVVRRNGHGRHLTTSDAFVLAREQRPEIGYSTVYRALQRLRDLGLVDEIAVQGSDSVIYEPASEPHAHFRCRSCGAVADIAYAIAPRTVRALAERYAIVVDEASLTFHGLCAACRPA